jgi:2'-5' RNA ligase
VKETPMPDEILRTFIAIELDEPLRIALRTIQDGFKRQVAPGSVKWVAPDGVHLTLKFLGDTPSSRLPEIEEGLRAACAGAAPFEFSVEGRGCFPNFRRPRVIWVAVHDQSHALARLHSAIEDHIAPLGWPAEERGFSPHLTLGRVAKGADSRTAAAVGQVVEASVIEQIGQQKVNTIALIRSELRPTGAVYTELVSTPLAAGS